MISYWQMEPVGLQGIVNTSHHHSHIVGVVLGGVKVGVVSDKDWHLHGHMSDSEHAGILQLFVTLNRSLTLAEHLLQSDSSLMPEVLAKCHECIKSLLSLKDLFLSQFFPLR